MTRRWTRRLVALLLLVVVGQVVLTLLDFDPAPVRWALLATAALTSWWLVLDVADIGGASWDEPQAPYTRPDAADDSVHHRVLTNHLAAREPGPALHRLLVGLALTRDPDLEDPDLRALAHDPTQRLTASDIDRYLTKIEESRDRE